MARIRRTGMQLLELKIEQAEEKVAKTRTAHNAAVDELKKLTDERKALQSKELAEAVSQSKRTYSEIIAFIRSDPEADTGEQEA